MLPTTIVFLRHAETQKDKTINAAQWILSDVGSKQAIEASELEIMKNINVIYTSEEIKTILTAKPIAEKNNLHINSLNNFNEVQRGDKFFSKEEFEAEKEKQLIDLDYNAFSGESGNEALLRFKTGVLKVFKENQEKTILIVTHGTILNIYFASALNVLSELPTRWQKTQFCAFGVMTDWRIVKDIV